MLIMQVLKNKNLSLNELRNIITSGKGIYRCLQCGTQYVVKEYSELPKQCVNCESELTFKY